MLRYGRTMVARLSLIPRGIVGERVAAAAGRRSPGMRYTASMRDPEVHLTDFEMVDGTAMGMGMGGGSGVRWAISASRLHEYHASGVLTFQTPAAAVGPRGGRAPGPGLWPGSVAVAMGARDWEDRREFPAQVVRITRGAGGRLGSAAVVHVAGTMPPSVADSYLLS